MRKLGPLYLLPGCFCKRVVILCSLLFAAAAQAGEEWELISVTSGAGWEINRAQGTLKQNANVLDGVLKDKSDGNADYRIRIVLNGRRAEATFRFISENDRGSTLTGTYSTAASPTDRHCPEQIQLMNSFQYIGLARDRCQR